MAKVMLLPWLVAVAVAAPPTFGPGLYKGSLRLATATVTVSLKLRRPMPDGHIDMPEQGLRRHPLTAMVVDRQTLRFDLPGLPGAPRFALKWRKPQFEGVYGQGGRTYPIRLARISADDRLQNALLGLAPKVKEALSKDGASGLSYAVVLDGEVRFGSFGQRADQPRPTERTSFPLGSLTRTILSITAAAWLESEDRWTWSTPIANALPYFRLERPDGGGAMTLAALLTGSVPIAEHAVARDALGPANPTTLLLRLGALPLASTFQESDWMYAAIGQLLANPPGSSDGKAAVERFLSTYALDLSYAETPNDLHPAFRVATDLQGSTRALADLLRLYLSRAILLPDTWRRLEATGAGGWQSGHRRGFRTRRARDRTSRTSTTLLMAPDDDAGVVVFVDRAQSPLSDLLANDLLDRLLGLVPSVDLAAAVESKDAAPRRADTRIPRRVKRTRPAHALSAYTGTFVHPGYGRLIVESNSGRLGVRLGPLAAPLKHLHFETFVSDPKDALQAVPWTFITSVEGRIEAVESPLEPRTAPIRFERAQ